MKRFLTQLVLSITIFNVTNIDAQIAYKNSGLLATESAVQTAVQTDEEKTKSELELKKKALALLEQISGETSLLRRSQNRILAQSALANAWWTQDEERGRAMFHQVIAEFNAAAVAQIKKLKRQARPNDFDYENLSLSRRNLVSVTASQSPDMALEILQQTRSAMLEILAKAELKKIKLGENVNEQSFWQEEASTEQWIAGQLAAKNPQQALHLARRSLSNNLSAEVLELLDQLQKADAQAAAEFAEEIAQKITLIPIKIGYRDEQIYLISQLLTRSSTQLPNEVSAAEDKSENITQITLDASIERKLAERLASGLLTSQNNELSDEQFAQTMLVLEKLLPKDQVLALQEKHRSIKQLQQSLQPATSTDFERYLQIASLNSPEQMLSEISKLTDEEFRNNVYQLAALKTAETGDEPGARQIINLIPNEEKRLLAFDNLAGQLSDQAADKENYEQALEMIAKISNTNWRIQKMIELSESLQSKSKTLEAEQLLDQASALIRENALATDSYESLTLVGAYTRIAPEKAFAALEIVLELDNRMIAENALQSAANSNDNLLQKGELDFEQLNSHLLWRYADLAALAANDWERTLNIIDQIERPEVRLAIKIVLAQFILTNQQTLFEEGGC